MLVLSLLKVSDCYGYELVKKIKETKAPIVVGLDPMLSYVPEYIKKTAFDEYGETLEGAAEAMEEHMKRSKVRYNYR